MSSFRTTLEVLKFASYTDTSQYSLLSSLWHKSASSDELWFSYHHFYSLLPAHSTPAKQSFLRQRRRQLQVALVTSNRISLFDCLTQQWMDAGYASHRIRVGTETAAAFLPNGSVLICGGFDWATEKAGSGTFEVTADWKVSRQDNLTYARGGIGLIVCEGAVYTFGGFDGGRVDVCEILRWSWDNTESPWEDGAKMTKKRAYINPCTVVTTIYLVSGDEEGTAETHSIPLPLPHSKQSSPAETFDTQTSAYKPLSLPLLNPRETLAFIHNSELLLLQPGCITRFNGCNAITIFSDSKFDIGWSCFSPCVVGNEVFVVSAESCSVQKIDIVQGKIHEILPGKSKFKLVFTAIS